MHIEANNLPQQLREVIPRVASLYTRGAHELLAGVSVAVVGARKASAYGELATERLAGGLARAGVVVVSGLAYGVDSWAHRAAMDAGGKTIAVLASGLDCPLPGWQQELADEVVARGGCLVSEQAAEAPALKHHFLLRNRIIAGLSLGTIVVEARDKSGALVTANYALEANRVVFAVPGDIDRETSVGPNRLITQGAVLVRDVQDVLDQLAAQLPCSVMPAGVATDSAAIRMPLTALLSETPRSLEEIAEQLKQPLPEVLATLSQLELDGRVVRSADGRFSNKK